MITKKIYKVYTEEVHELMNGDPDLKSYAERERLMLISLAIQDYEKKYFIFEAPTAIEAIKFRMNEMGLRQADTAPYFGGSQSRISEIFHGKRRLTLAMIRKLHEGLKIPLEVLIK